VAASILIARAANRALADVAGEPAMGRGGIDSNEPPRSEGVSVGG
jgi:hypothetical protein